jgi:predicted unusual protein kinase regulating ubiquinone biosynthesis (AarF/ABC1/UbiB family)
VFDSFTKDAVNAASIGQVHKAELNGKKLAIKIQYPGVADSISSDLKLVKPLAGRLFNMNTRDLNEYLEEVEEKLIEETDYLLELERSNKISKACSSLHGVRFPKYYEELSARRILTMDWIDGLLLTEYIKTNPSQERRNEVGQRMWDFFLFQMQELRLMHADPHPGNFIVDKDNNLCVLDFGCVKEINENFANNYFKLLSPNILDEKDKLEEIYMNMSFFRPEDKDSDKIKLRSAYQEMIGVLALPFHTSTFDFGSDDYFKKIFSMGEQFSNDKELRKLNNARGSKDAIYVFRTFFGLYNLLHQLKAEVTLNYKLYESVSAA